MTASDVDHGGEFEIEGVAYGAAGCGVAAILLWALYDAWLLSHYDVSVWRGWIAAAAYGVGVAVSAAVGELPPLLPDTKSFNSGWVPSPVSDGFEPA